MPRIYLYNGEEQRPVWPWLLGLIVIVGVGSCVGKAGLEGIESARQFNREVLAVCADVPGRDYNGCMSRETTRRRLER